MVDLRADEDERSRRAVARVLDSSARLSRLLGLRDYFSMDFRIDADGRPTLFEFEVCPGVTIYDFQNYLARRGVTLGDALAKAMGSLSRAGARSKRRRLARLPMRSKRRDRSPGIGLRGVAPPD